jgi:hypothetical protein
MILWIDFLSSSFSYYFWQSRRVNPNRTKR